MVENTSCKHSTRSRRAPVETSKQAIIFAGVRDDDDDDDDEGILEKMMGCDAARSSTTP